MDATSNKKIDAYCSNNMVETCHKSHMSIIQKPNRLNLGMNREKRGYILSSDKEDVLL